MQIIRIIHTLFHIRINNKLQPCREILNSINGGAFGGKRNETNHVLHILVISQIVDGSGWCWKQYAVMVEFNGEPIDSSLSVHFAINIGRNLYKSQAITIKYDAKKSHYKAVP